jgi:bacterioferritin-associated ferredoxin
MMHSGGRMYVCSCKALTKADVRHFGRAGITTPDALIAVLHLNDEDCCGQCATQIEDFVELAREGLAQANDAPEPRYARARI